MRKSHYTEEQIAFALKQAELGTAVAEVYRELGISEATFFRWEQKYGGLGPSELRRLKQLEEENNKLKRLVADFSLDNVRDAFEVSEWRGCWALRFHHSSQRYRGRRDDQAPLRACLSGLLPSVPIFS